MNNNGGVTGSSTLTLRGQDTLTPDINVERDVVEIALGADVAEKSTSTQNRFQVNLATIFLSALIFIAILTWIDFIQAAFFLWSTGLSDAVPPPVKFWYSIFITLFTLVICYFIYYYHIAE